MAGISDFALAAATGISVMACYRPREWERFKSRVIRAFALIAGFTAGSVGALKLADLAPAVRASILTGSAAFALLVVWTFFMDWLTSPTNDGGKSDSADEKDAGQSP